MIGVRFGEGFFSAGPVGVSTLPNVFGDRGPRPSGYQLFN
jgi:hypothetical protein